jgi:adenine-specific DNA-methyltransferase
MASMFRLDADTYHLLDPGAGVGSLTAAWIAELCSRKRRPKSVAVTAYEVDELMLSYLDTTMKACAAHCEAAGVRMEWRIEHTDFVRAAVDVLDTGCFRTPREHAFSAAILNPPYRKINSDSDERSWLRHIGIETSNLYSAFFGLVVRLLEPGAQLVAITPRSFCNGPYFKPFRELFLKQMALRRVHLFESRDRAFSDDTVLQENLILHADKTDDRAHPITITTAAGPDDDHPVVHEMAYAEVVRPNDPDAFIHIVPDHIARRVAEQMERFTSSLDAVGLIVSTGRVVDFRARRFLRLNPEPGTVPLIYPTHFAQGFIRWPKRGSKKPNAIVAEDASRNLLVPSGTYVLVRRFSAKEETRRIVAAIYEPSRLPKVAKVGFENHLNYYHVNGHGLSRLVARGLAVYLNSTLVDEYFRLFNGHTQVNATDLRNLRYPDREALERLASYVSDVMPSQVEIDRIINAEFFDTSEDRSRMDPVRAKRRIEEAIEVLRMLGLPPAQQNDRSALTLLALLNLTPAKPWSEAADPLLGVWAIMGFMEKQYGKTYAANTRETIRRQTLHQFLDAGIVVQNPDDPKRPTNRPENAYQIEPGTLALLRTFGTADWDADLATHLASIETLKQRYAQEPGNFAGVTPDWNRGWRFAARAVTR